MEISYYFKGGISYTEAMQLSATEREIAVEVIQKKMEDAKKLKIPFI